MSAAALEALEPVGDLVDLAERLGRLHDALSSLELEALDLCREALRLAQTLEPQEV